MRFARSCRILFAVSTAIALAGSEPALAKTKARAGTAAPRAGGASRCPSALKGPFKAATPAISFTDNKAGKGGLKCHETVIATSTVKLYRYWDGPSAQRLGKYWTEGVASSLTEARKTLAVCPKWNVMTMLTTCDLPPGKQVVRGPGQTASCPGLAAGGAWLPGGPQQVFVLDPAATLVNCHDTPTGWKSKFKAPAAASGAKPGKKP